jgi:hypothetical protein
MADDEYYLDALMDASDDDENDDVLCASTDNGDVQHSVMNDEDCYRAYKRLYLPFPSPS